MSESFRRPGATWAPELAHLLHTIASPIVPVAGVDRGQRGSVWIALSLDFGLRDPWAFLADRSETHSDVGAAGEQAFEMIDAISRHNTAGRCKNVCRSAA